MESHEHANIFPMMQKEEFEELKDDLKINGLIEAITTFEGKIIDGRNRYKACLETNTKPRFEEWNGSGSLVQYIVSLNLKRRHLTSSQRAVLALRILPALEEEAKERQVNAGKIYGVGQPEEDNLTIDMFEDEKKKVNQKIGEPFEKKSKALQTSAQTAAKIAGTNHQYISAVKKIQKEKPELIKEILEGKKTIQEAKTETKMPHVSNNSGNNEWYTPKAFIDSARVVLGVISLDPASSKKANETVKALRFFDIEENGLSQDWKAKNVWMNPPYESGLIQKFIEKFLVEYSRNNFSEGIILVNNATETKWFQNLIKSCQCICFPCKRVKFIDMKGNPSGTPLQGQAVLYLGRNRECFTKEFNKYGEVVQCNTEILNND
tara:strand:- start:1528 stop:2661 length:1134 start_codon:yes stop_codon:yes gene_type:complete